MSHRDNLVHSRSKVLPLAWTVETMTSTAASRSMVPGGGLMMGVEMAVNLLLDLFSLKFSYIRLIPANYQLHSHLYDRKACTFGRLSLNTSGALCGLEVHITVMRGVPDVL